MYAELNPYFTPFDYINIETNYDVISEKETRAELNTIVDNLNNFYSSVVKNYGIQTSRFVIGKYNLGLTKLNATNLSGSRMIAQRINLTRPDILENKSFITLPEPVVRFSRINLPGTSILDRANLNNVFVNYWKLLKEKTNVDTIYVDSLTQEIEFNESIFLKGITNYTLNLSEEDKKGFTYSEIYEQFVQNIVPSIRVLFNMVKKYITGKLTILDVVSYLEPFLVYTDDLTYKQYQTIISFITKEIANYNKTFPEKHRLFLKLKRVRSSKELSAQAFSLINILSKKDRLRENILEENYDIDGLNRDLLYSNSELLRKIILKDYGNVYYNALSSEGIPLKYPDDLSSIFENEEKNLSREEKEAMQQNKCVNYIVAKQYSSEDEMMSDNNVDIYFDKKFDNTKYGILDSYEKEMINLSSEDFFNFLTKEVKRKLKLTDEEAEYLADTLISGVKRVLDGNYAIIYKINASNETVMEYYVRKNNKWELDNQVNKDLFVGNQNILCNFQEKCISVPSSIDDKCQSIQQNEITLKQRAIKDILQEFDDTYKISKEEFEKKMKERTEYYQGIIPLITHIEFNQLLKYNYMKYKIGVSIEEDKTGIIVSPYFKIRDIILGGKDFIQKQNDIIRFVINFTREYFEGIIGPLGEEESKYWLYCNKTNVKLLPAFIYQLACCFINDYENYPNLVDQTIKEIGTLSDDGDSWVDKHSGYVIRKIDFDVEEGYEEGGFKIKSRDLLEQDLGDTLLQENSKKGAPQYDSPESKMIFNVITALSVSMGINLESQREFIMNGVTTALQETLPKESSYKKKIQEMANKGKSRLDSSFLR